MTIIAAPDTRVMTRATAGLALRILRMTDPMLR